MKQIDGKLDKLSGIGAYKGRTKTLAEKRQVQREVRERAKEWLREQESKLRKKLVAKYQDERKKIIKKSFAELEMKGGDFFYHETKRRKENCWCGSKTFSLMTTRTRTEVLRSPSTSTRRIRS